jgi:hypothetical protein
LDRLALPFFCLVHAYVRAEEVAASGWPPALATVSGSARASLPGAARDIRPARTLGAAVGRSFGETSQFCGSVRRDLLTVASRTGPSGAASPWPSGLGTERGGRRGRC